MSRQQACRCLTAADLCQFNLAMVLMCEASHCFIVFYGMSNRIVAFEDHRKCVTSTNAQAHFYPFTHDVCLRAVLLDLFV